MKKTFLTCMAVVALLAVASGAGAITCTIDQRPAATLLIPYFQASFDPETGLPATLSVSAVDTLVTIGNASSAPMIAHLSVFSERSLLVLDINIALTGFDIQSFSVARLLAGFLPVTPTNQNHKDEVKDTNQVTINGDVCQRVSASVVYPTTGGYLRVKPTNPTSSADNTFATVAYGPGPFPQAFRFQILDSLDTTKDEDLCVDGIDEVIVNPIHGYITIDHANYCNLSNPSVDKYWTNDAAGMENNLWGDYIFTNAQGIGTFGLPAVAIEADPSLADDTEAPTTLNGVPGRRTFYRRYVTTADNLNVDGVGCSQAFPSPQDTFDCGFGDQREPLGLKYAARWFDVGTQVTSFFNVWRASAVPAVAVLAPGGLQDLIGPPPNKCTASEPEVLLTFFDEDENTVTTGCTVSPCPPAPTFNFPLETQRTSIVGFTHPAWPAGWVSMEFFNSTGPVGGALDQAYVTYDFQGRSQFLDAGIQAAQLDPTNCQPLLVPVAPAAGGVTPTDPAIPAIVGTGPS